MTTMDLPELIILDVGHGNCTLLRDRDETIVIDCGSRATLIETLRALDIQEIAHVLISHADADHIGGLINLLSEEDVRINSIHLNPDATKKSQIWEDLRYAVKDAGKRGTTVFPSLTTTKTGKLNTSQVEIEVLAPTPALSLGGAGGKDLRGRKLTSNSISAVIGLVHHSHRIAILGGDIDTIGWDNLIQDNTDLQADILVFPHHGGKPGGGTNERAFARQLCQLIKPNLVIFSIGRQHFANPREEIVAEVRDGDPSPHIWCTQLAKKCAQKTLSAQPQHLNPLPAKGRQKNSCCGGTLAIKINGNKTDYTNQINEHRTFIDRQIPTPLCQL